MWEEERKGIWDLCSASVYILEHKAWHSRALISSTSITSWVWSWWGISWAVLPGGFETVPFLLRQLKATQILLHCCLMPAQIQMFISRRKCGAVRMMLCLSPPPHASAPANFWQLPVTALSLGLEHLLVFFFIIWLVVEVKRENQCALGSSSCPSASSLHHCLGGFWLQRQDQGSKRARRTWTSLNLSERRQDI